MDARWSAVRRSILPAALVVALGLVAVLARQKTAQEERYATLRENTSLPRRGVFVPTFVAQTIEGDSITIGERPDSGKQVLFLFTATCPYCKASLPAIREIADAAAAAPDVGMVGIVLDSLDHAIAYAHANALSFRSSSFPLGSCVTCTGRGPSPTVLVLDAEGRILLGRVGVLDSRPPIDSILAVIQAATVESEVASTRLSR